MPTLATTDPEDFDIIMSIKDNLARVSDIGWETAASNIATDIAAAKSVALPGDTTSLLLNIKTRLYGLDLVKEAAQTDAISALIS